MQLKTIGTYNDRWFLKVWEAHQLAAVEHVRFRVTMSGEFATMWRLRPGPLTLKDVR